MDSENLPSDSSLYEELLAPKSVWLKIGAQVRRGAS